MEHSGFHEYKDGKSFNPDCFACWEKQVEMNKQDEKEIRQGLKEISEGKVVPLSEIEREMTDKPEASQLLTSGEIKKCEDDARRVSTMDLSMPVDPNIFVQNLLKAQLTKYQAKKHWARPDREGIAVIAKDPRRQRIIKRLAKYDAMEVLPSVSDTVDQLLVLFPDEEEIRKQERERIKAWVNKPCPHIETASQVTLLKWGCPKCWQALGEK